LAGQKKICNFGIPVLGFRREIGANVPVEKSKCCKKLQIDFLLNPLIARVLDFREFIKLFFAALRISNCCFLRHLPVPVAQNQPKPAKTRPPSQRKKEKVAQKERKNIIYTYGTYTLILEWFNTSKMCKPFSAVFLSLKTILLLPTYWLTGRGF
jgi:hypothetical protein